MWRPSGRSSPPQVNIAAGKTVGTNSTGHGNRHLARVLREIAVAVGRAKTFLGARYRRLAPPHRKKKAIVAIARSNLVIVWDLLANPTMRFHDLGVDHYDTDVNNNRRVRNRVRELDALGYTVTLEPAA